MRKEEDRENVKEWDRKTAQIFEDEFRYLAHPKMFVTPDYIKRDQHKTAMRLTAKNLKAQISET